MLAIKNNIMAANAARHLGKAYNSLAKSVERLSSGLRINSAKDDAAGLAVRELIRADIAVLQQGSRNAQDGISLIQTMEGAMAVIDENLIRMEELAEQAATGSYSSAQRTIMNAEFAEMASEIDRIANNTKFNNITMLNETALTNGSNDVKIHVGSTATIDVEKSDMTKSGLNIETGDGGWEVAFDTGSTAGVSAASDTWITLTESNVTDGGSANDSKVTLTIQFVTADTGVADESAIDVVMDATSTGSTTVSLASLVSQINNASQNLGWDSSGNDLRYDAAEAYYNSAQSEYVLKISSRDSLADEYSMDFAGINTEAGTTGVTGKLTILDDVASGTVSDDMGAGTTAAGVNILTVDAATSALLSVVSAISDKDTARAAFGYKMNRLESTIAILDIQSENLMAAESRISDVDVATEMATLTRTQVLSQAGIAMLAQANSMPQMALTLLSR